jgi:hypothetical protein
MARLLGHARVKRHLQKEIAEFVAQIGDIAALNRVSDFVCLFDRIGCDRRKVLLEIPGTAGDRRAQRGYDVDEGRDVTRGLDQGRAPVF